MRKPLRYNSSELLGLAHDVSLTSVGKLKTELVHPDPARPQAASRLAGYRTGRHRHRTRHPEDPARKPTSSCSGAACRRAGPASSPPAATATPGTACSPATPATSKGP